MGLAASQARLLSLTGRIHDVEYQAQMIQSAKLQLAMQEDEAYRKYNEALDAQTLTFQDLKGNRIKATFNNLCGLGSINNEIATDKSYAFRDKDGNLIIPSDVYDGYVAYGGSDPYAFAMYMLTDGEYKKDAIEDAESTFFSGITDDDAVYGRYKEKITNLIENQIYNNSECTLKKGEELKEQQIKDATNAILSSGTVSASAFFNNGKIPENAKDAMESLEKIVQEYKFKVHQRDGKAIFKSIDSTTIDENKFDEQKFNYYLKWGKFIQHEEIYKQGEDDLVGATKASVYNKSFDIENDAEALNQMLQSGKISIDMYYINNSTGEVDDKPTSTSSDSNLAMTTKSSLDSTELKRAEAEYEKTLKDINRKDKRYDMDLSKLDTERTALTKEYDSVKQVIKDNIERTFGIFS